MKLATYNVNGVNGRLEVLLRRLEEAAPDVACLQELKVLQEKFPINAIEAAGYGAVWQGQKSWNGVAILAKGQEPHLTRRRLPGEPEDEHSRYIEAVVDGIVIGGLYLPNVNPYPGPKFDYKLRWFKRLQDYAAELLKLEVPVVLVGDFDVMPNEMDVYKPERWTNDALFRVEVRNAYRKLVDQGWTDALRHLHPTNASTRSETTSEMHTLATPDCGSTTSCSARSRPPVCRRPKSTSTYAAGSTQATMLPYGSN